MVVAGKVCRNIWTRRECRERDGNSDKSCKGYKRSLKSDLAGYPSVLRTKRQPHMCAPEKYHCSTKNGKNKSRPVLKKHLHFYAEKKCATLSRLKRASSRIKNIRQLVILNSLGTRFSSRIKNKASFLAILRKNSLGPATKRVKICH